MINDFVFITDTHINLSSRVRTGDYLSDLLKKLEFVVEYANKNNAIILHGGDFFDKPTVSDVVKNKLIPVLLRAKYKPLVIYGNHDKLFNNDENDVKTSLETLVVSGVVEILTTKDFGNLVVTSELPVINKNKAQICVCHGFLNKEDGKYTFRFTDIETTDQVKVLLGHDHVVYENLKLSNVEYIRPGSFVRGIRDDEAYREVFAVHLRMINGEIKSKLVKIPCRDPKEIFQTKESKLKTKEVDQSYDSLIQMLANSTKGEETLEGALNILATPAEKEYILNVLNEELIIKQSK